MLSLLVYISDNAKINIQVCTLCRGERERERYFLPLRAESWSTQRVQITCNSRWDVLNWYTRNRQYTLKFWGITRRNRVCELDNWRNPQKHEGAAKSKFSPLFFSKTIIEREKQKRKRKNIAAKYLKALYISMQRTVSRKACP